MRIRSYAGSKQKEAPFSSLFKFVSKDHHISSHHHHRGISKVDDMLQPLTLACAPVPPPIPPCTPMMACFLQRRTVDASHRQLGQRQGSTQECLCVHSPFPARDNPSPQSVQNPDGEVQPPCADVARHWIQGSFPACVLRVTRGNNWGALELWYRCFLTTAHGRTTCLDLKGECCTALFFS